MKLEEFDYYLPRELIAQKPISPRDASRLLILDRKNKKIFHRYFYEIGDFLSETDVLVLNNTRVIPARLFGKKITGGKVEILLLREKSENIWEALLKGKIKIGEKVFITDKFYFEILAKKINTWEIRPNLKKRIFLKKLKQFGRAPTPPYIKRLSNLKEYQTIYARYPGSVAAPTAGFHFTKKLIKTLKRKGVKFEFITLHVNLGTFQPVRVENVEEHRMDPEWAEIKSRTAYRLNRFKKEGLRIIAVGTTSCRTLEAFADKNHLLQPGQKEIDLFIYPGYQFKFTDALITNFHLPRSTPLLLVSALAGRDLIFKAYQEAIKRKYRFYSFGDAMLIL